MWELTIELEDNQDVYFQYSFENFSLLSNWIEYNEKFNLDHCIYTIEAISKED